MIADPKTSHRVLDGWVMRVSDRWASQRCFVSVPNIGLQYWVKDLHEAASVSEDMILPCGTPPRADDEKVLLICCRRTRRRAVS